MSDDTTPVMNRPQRVELSPETRLNPDPAFRPSWRPGDHVDTPVFDVMFDIDDVLCPTIDSIHQLAYEAGLHDGSIEPAWDGAGQYGCEPEAYWDLWSTFAASGGYVTTAPIPDAARALRELYWAGHRIHLVTARGFMAHAQEIRDWTPQWLENFALPWHTLTYAQDKVAAQVQVFDALGEVERVDHMADGHVDPVRRTIVSPKFHYAIDDRRKTIEALRDVGVKAYLLTHSHNRSEPSDHRVGSVTEFVHIILEAARP